MEYKKYQSTFGNGKNVTALFRMEDRRFLAFVIYSVLLDL